MSEICNFLVGYFSFTSPINSSAKEAKQWTESGNALDSAYVPVHGEFVHAGYTRRKNIIGSEFVGTVYGEVAFVTICQGPAADDAFRRKTELSPCQVTIVFVPSLRIERVGGGALLIPSVMKQPINVRRSQHT